MRATPKVYQPEAFAYRVNYAAQCILRGTKTRASETCFEMNDGDAVVIDGVCVPDRAAMPWDIDDIPAAMPR